MEFFKGIGLALLLGFSSSAFADKVAALNVQQALLSSNAAESFRKEVDAEFKPQSERLRDLEQQVKKLQGELQNAHANGASQEELQQKNLQYQKLVTEFQRQGQELQLQHREREQAFLAKMRPRLDAVIRDLIDKGGYDMVINKSSTIFTKPELDITQKVVELLNQQ